VNGQKVADARIDQTQCCMFSLDEAADVGRNEGTPVTEDYKVPIASNGVIDKVTHPGRNPRGGARRFRCHPEENRSKRTTPRGQKAGEGERSARRVDGKWAGANWLPQSQRRRGLSVASVA
jgi:hypothetical protein